MEGKLHVTFGSDFDSHSVGGFELSEFGFNPLNTELNPICQ